MYFHAAAVVKDAHGRVKKAKMEYSTSLCRLPNRNKFASHMWGSIV